MTPQALYDSPWQQPGLLASVALVGLAWALMREYPKGELGSFLRRWALVFGIEIVLDAWLTSPLSPLAGGALTALSVAFVIAGDFRLFLLVTRWGTRLSLGARWAAGFALAMVASLVVAGAKLVTPATFAVARRTYLLYELVSLALMGVLWSRRAAFPETHRGWIAAVLGFGVVQYALWSVSDVLLLSGVSGAYLLRVVPNVLYYGLFVAFVARRTTRGAA